MALGLVVLAAGTGYVGFRLAVGGSARTHDGSLDIGDRPGPPRSPESGAGTRPRIGPIRVMTEGPRNGRPGEPTDRQSQALAAFDGDVEASPVTGSVTNEDKESVPAARVAVRLMTAGARHSRIGDVVASTLTDAEGRFSLVGFHRLGERYVLDVTHPEYALARTPPVNPLKPSTTRRDVVLVPGVHIAGTITNQEGNPLTGVEVTAYDLDLVSLSPGGRVEGRATTDNQGRYEIEHLRRGTKRVVTRAHGLANGQQSPVRLGASVETLDFRLAAGHHIAGRVIDGDTGMGIGDVVVRAQPVGSAQIPSRGGSPARSATGAGGKSGDTARTAPDGTFRIAGLTRSQHVVSVVRGLGEVGTVNATPGGEDIELRVRLQGTIAGRVVDAATGDPITRFSFTVSRGPRPALVSPAGTRRVADPNGAFAALDVAPGSHHLIVDAPGYARGMAGPVETSLGERVAGVVVRLERAILVHGRVVDAGGSPIAGAGVSIVEELQMAASTTHPGILPQRRMDVHRSGVTTFADGSYLVPNVGKGRFHLTVGDPPRHIVTQTESFTLIGGEGSVEVSEVVLSRAATVTGTVFDEAGRPDYNAVVAAFPAVRVNGDALLSVGTDAQGRYRLEGLRSGTWRIAVTVSRGRMKMKARNGSEGRTVTLESGGRTNVDFRD
ncbi:MAG: carboxypeptidase regulatory-like domain-containing protein [Planctomycetes bacterium]|nr:carboxypeptidase regulatory-like domain-containing protein [Planctomycetota bacterium]